MMTKCFGTVMRCLILLIVSFIVHASYIGNDSENVVPTLVQIPRNQSHEISFTKHIGEIFIEDPKVVDVQVLSPNKIRLFTLDVGTTRVVISDRLGNKILEFRVEVTPNVEEVNEILREIFPQLKIHIRAIKHVIFIAGKVPNPKIASEVLKIIKAYLGDSDQIINNLEISLPNQVMIKVKVAEIKRDVSQSLGIDWSMFNQKKMLAPDGSVIPSFDKGFSAAMAGTTSKMNLEDIGTKTGLFPLKGRMAGLTGEGGRGGTMLNLASMRNGKFSYDVSAFIDVMAVESLATILAEPTLIAVSGQTATFQSGGEIPYKSTNGVGASNTEFKNYGISLEVTPTIISENLINLKVKPSVSDKLDSTDESQPMIGNRDVSTVVELADGQSIVIAGLLKRNTSSTSSSTSWLANIPIIGALFKQGNDANTEMELVIVVTAYIVRPIKEEPDLPIEHLKMSNVSRQALLGEMNVVTKRSGGDDDVRMPVTKDHNMNLLDSKSAVVSE